MSRRHWMALAALALLWTAAANASIWHQAGATSPVQTTAVDSKDGAIRVNPPAEMAIRVGQSRRVTWMVTGTTRPVHLRLRNNRPDIGTILGGDVKLVTTSGGKVNKVTLTVTGVSPGNLEIELLDMDWESDHSAREQQIASAFRTELARIADRLEAAARDVPLIHPRSSSLPPAVRGQDVLLLFDQTERDVRNSLPYRELAPFRDAVAEMLDGARGEIREEMAPGRRAAADFAIVLVRSGGGAAQSSPIAVEEFRTLVAGIAAFFRRTSEASPLAELCILTTPENEANVLLYPRSFPSDQQNVRTASRKTLYLGRYAFEVSKPNFGTSKGYVNLLLDPQRVVECELSRTVAVIQACRLIAGTIGRCP